MEKNHKYPILMYHSINNVSRNESMRSLHVSPKAFEKQMKALKLLGLRGCSVSELLTARAHGKKHNLVALTFDDGYKNFHNTALPVLKNYDFGATVYIVSGLIGGQNDWDANTGISTNYLMNENEILDCMNNGIEIGLHSWTHADMSKHDIDLQCEITKAKLALQNFCGSNISSFCYPYGRFSRSCIEHLKNDGFNSAVTMIRGTCNPNDNQFKLPRIPITWHTLTPLFVWKLFSNYEDNRRNHSDFM